MPTVADLKHQCKMLGLRTTGRKKELADRLEGFRSAQSTLVPETMAAQLAQRVSELEATIVRMQADIDDEEDSQEGSTTPRTILFQPLQVSSPQRQQQGPAIVNGVNDGGVASVGQAPEGARRVQPAVDTQAPMKLQGPVTSGGTCGAARTYAAPPSNVGVIGRSAAVEGVMNHVTGVQPTPLHTVQAAMHNTPISYAMPIHTAQASMHNAPTTYTMPTPNTQAPIHNTPTNNCAPWLGMGNGYNGGCSMKDVVAVLPEFDPVNENALNSLQFVNRVQALRDAYQWRDDLLVLAIQQKLKGHAKYWSDSQLEIFTSWQQFRSKFLQDFPCRDNEADVHIKLASTKRGHGISPQEYFYKMMAIGAKGNINERAIVRHIVNGINDHDLKKRLSNDYVSGSDLLQDIDNYCRYNEVRGAVREVREKDANVNVRVKRVDVDNSGSEKRRKCYNCAKIGHVAAKCPEPVKTQKCFVCQKAGHRARDCPESKASSNVRKVDTVKGANRDLTKIVSINGSIAKAFVDPGSERSLICYTHNLNLGKMQPCQVTLKGFGGGEYICTNKVMAELSIDEHIYDVEWLLVDNALMPETVLLGKDVICRDDRRMIIQGDECWVESVKKVAGLTRVIDEKQNKQLANILCEYRHCFAEDASELGTCSTTKMKIELTSDVPINQKPYRCPFPKREGVRGMVNELLQAGIIRRSNSPYASPIVVVYKKNKELRLCVDYRRLNQITVKIPFPMPIIDEQLAQLSGNKFFSSLDLRMGYHQVVLDEDSKKYTAFVTVDGHFEFNRMPFGLVNAASVFQRLMNTLASEMEPGEVLPYMDDVIVPSVTIEQGLDRLTRFLKVISSHGLTLRLDKCKFLVDKIAFLGHTITSEGVLPGDLKTSAVLNFKTPSNVTEVRRFLGLTGFFRKFVQDYALVSRPLTMLLHKSMINSFKWEDAQESSFNKLKAILCEKPVLQLYDYKAQHEVHTDASSLGLAGVFLQSHDGQRWNAVCYYSRHCTEAESRYHSYELEVLAVVETLTRLRVYLLGKKFKLVTDCAAIAKAKINSELIPKIARWYIRIMEFDFDVVHRPAQRLVHVDALSRAPDQPSRVIEPLGSVRRVDVVQKDWILTMQLQDVKLAEIIDILEGRKLSDQLKHLQSEFQLRNSRLFRISNGLKLVIPKAIRWRVTKSCHDDVGHFGLEKTIERIQRDFWFPRIRKYCKDYIAACVECCFNKAKGGRAEGQLHFDEVVPVPFHTLHLDHLGPFVRSTKGMSYVLAISDAFSKMLVVKAVRHTKTLPVINALRELTVFFGLPKRVITDRGTAFTSKAFMDFCEHNDIQHIKTAVRTPRANGQVERANQYILNVLRTTTESPRHWDECLRDLQWAINSQRNKTTGFTPNDLIFDFPLRDLTQNRLLVAIHDEDKEEVAETAMGEKRAHAADNIRKEREKWQVRFNKQHAAPTKYIVGDLVVIAHEPAATGESRKLEPKFKGPYMVKKVLPNDRYIIADIPGMQIKQRPFESVFAVDKMKRWCDSCPELDGCDDEGLDAIEDDVVSGMDELSELN